MSEKPISPLRQRMLEDMNMRRFVPDTQREYIRAVKKLASFLGRSPDSATPEELRAFQLHLTETGLQPQSINATVTALGFFFKVTLCCRRCKSALFWRQIGTARASTGGRRETFPCSCSGELGLLLRPTSWRVVNVDV